MDILSGLPALGDDSVAAAAASACASAIRSGVRCSWEAGEKKLTNWDGWWSRIVLVSLEEGLDVIDRFISSIQKICVRCRNVDDIIGSGVLDLLPDFLHLEVYCLQVKGDRSRDTGDGLTGIMEDSDEHYVWVYVNV